MDKPPVYSLPLKRGIAVFALLTLAAVAELRFNCVTTRQITEINNTSPLFWDTQDIDCDSIPDTLKKVQDSSEINSLRRKLMIQSPSCFTEDILLLFKTKFESMLTKRHIMLHIPKTGGTTVCTAAKNTTNLSLPRDRNCWLLHYNPVWCCFETPDQKPTCSQLTEQKEYNLDFIMNENWLDDICDDRTYSIIIREPISRTQSNVNHLIRFMLKKRKKEPNLNTQFTQESRLSLSGSNYMTWALTAGVVKTEENPFYFEPLAEHLEIAQNRLLQMDYIIDLDHNNSQCTKTILNFAGIDYKSTHSNQAESGYTNHFRSADTALLNSLDIQLYEFATRLIDIDCKFVALMREHTTLKLARVQNNTM